MPDEMPRREVQATAAPDATPQASAISGIPGIPGIPVLPASPGAVTGTGVTDGSGQGTSSMTEIPPPYRNTDIPREVIPLVAITLSLIVAMVVGYPIARAIGRVIEKRGQAGVLKAAEVAPQLRALQDSMDAMAIELERIGEAQRFTAKLMSDRAQVLPAGTRSPG